MKPIWSKENSTGRTLRTLNSRKHIYKFNLCRTQKLTRLREQLYSTALIDRSQAKKYAYGMLN